MITNRLRILLLWLILIVCMILHFDYYVSEAMSGFAAQKSTGGESSGNGLVFIRTAFHVLPLLYIAVVMWTERKALRWINFVLALLYNPAHFMHLSGELKKGENPSQMLLLSVTAVLATMLSVASRRWIREHR